MGSVSVKPLFLCRDGWYHSGRVFFRRAFFQLDVVRVVVFRLRAVLSRSGDLFVFHFAGEDQMGCLGFSGVLAAWICPELEFLPHGAGRCFKQLSNRFRRNRTERSGSRLSRLARRRGILHGAFAESRNACTLGRGGSPEPPGRLRACPERSEMGQSTLLS